ncbi:MAG: glycosyl hydrolase [Clostridiaceae bacterium]|nr:glycosyl hydrolase [Clostridiaceae bacterium]
MEYKRFLSILLLICFFIAAPLNNTFAASAGAKLPSEFWKLAPLYQNAIDSNDLNNIIIYGNKIIELFNGAEETQQVLEIITPRLENVAKAYEALGKFDNAVETYSKYIPKAEKLGWKDGVNYASSKINSLGFDIELYAKAPDLGKNLYFGSKHEPRSGVYFGSNYDSDPRIGAYSWNDIKNYFPKKNSAYLTYLHWEENIKSFDRYYQDAKENNIAVQLAWNIEDAQIDSVLKNIASYESYIKATADYLGKLKIPVFLRFAGEMNIKDNCKDSNSYIKAFIYVSKIMKDKAPNVAMVWSPNDISAKDRTYDQYYPGNEYVDWIGISTYTYRYFQGKKDWGNQQDSIDSVFMTGDYANPLSKIKPIIDVYGGRKPIMLSETGVGHYSKLAREDVSDWAAVQLRRLYTYGPMVYPQLKGIYYFNANNDFITKYDDYSLYGSSKFNTLYNELVSSSNFLSEINGNPSFRYEKVTDYSTPGFKLELSTYTIVPKLLTPTVKYKLDGKIYGTKTVLPYSIELDLSALTKGEHQFAVEVYNGNSKVGSKDYILTVNNDNISLKKK